MGQAEREAEGERDREGSREKETERYIQGERHKRREKESPPLFPWLVHAQHVYNRQSWLKTKSEPRNPLGFPT